MFEGITLRVSPRVPLSLSLSLSCCVVCSPFTLPRPRSWDTMEAVWSARLKGLRGGRRRGGGVAETRQDGGRTTRSAGVRACPHLVKMCLMRAFSWRCRASSCAACVPSADRFMSKGPTPSTSGVSGRPYLSSPRETEKQRTSAVMSAHGHHLARALTSRCRSTAFPPRARGSSRPPLSTPSSSCSDLNAGAVFSGLKRLRIFGERRSPLEISRRRDSPRVQVLDSSIVIVVASRREMYMYSKKKKSALFYTRRKVAWHSLNHHHKVGDRRTLGESERAFRERTPERTQPRRRRQPPSREGPRELDRERPRERRERGQRL